MANSPALPKRPYAAGGPQLSVVGFGGILVMNETQANANRMVAEAVEAGVNYFDVAPTYGNAEERLGPALEPHRGNCFLACKTTRRDAAAARVELAQSLQRLRTEHFDLYQLHAMQDMTKDVDVAFGKGGVVELLEEAKKSGRVRHVGFSAHSAEAAIAAMDRFPFDSILMPVNFATFHAGQFGPKVVAEARRRNVAILALKSMARQTWPAEIGKDHPERQRFSKCWYQPLSDPVEAQLALRFTLSQPVVAALPPGEAELFWRAVEIARHFAPVTEAELETLRHMTASLNPLFAHSA